MILRSIGLLFFPGDTMLFLIIYDITNDRLRNRIADTLKDYGLDRIQYSAFLGFLKRFELNSLIADLKKLLSEIPFTEDERVRNIQIYPIPEISRRGRIEINFEKGRLRELRGERIVKEEVVEII